jgi:hypothetical protein
MVLKPKKVPKFVERAKKTYFCTLFAWADWRAGVSEKRRGFPRGLFRF